MVAMICNPSQYDAPIAMMRMKEKALIHQANHTHKNGELMALSVKYQHVNYRLNAEIEDQNDCFEVQTWHNRQWFKTHGSGETR